MAIYTSAKPTKWLFYEKFKIRRRFVKIIIKFPRRI